MITLINGSESAQYPVIMGDVHRLRARVFHERLKWDVTVVGGMERDHYDDMNPLYIVSQDEVGRVRGTVRLLPTTGPNMLRDTFPELLPDGESVSSPTIWESSRFAVDRQDLELRSSHAVNHVTAELLLAETEIGMRVGLEFIVSVVDVHMLRVLQRAGCPCELLGKRQKIGKVSTVVGLWEIGVQLIENLRTASGITQPVLPQSTSIANALAA